MRRLAFLLLAPLPAQAWEFSPVPICTMRHAEAAAEMVVTYDPAVPVYAISVTLAEGAWPDAPVFAIAFLGGAELTISTDRHVRSPDGRTLTVTDRGFGNVLAGLERNLAAVAMAGAVSVQVGLDGAGDAVRAFRDCPARGVS